MTDYEIHELMTCRVAAEVDERGVTVMGSFTPLAYASYMLAKLTHARDAYLVGFDAVGMAPIQLSFTGAEASAYKGAACRWGMLTEINSIHLAGHGGVEAVSSAQFDGNGAINLSAIGPFETPKVRLPGGAGAAEVIKMYRKMIAYFGNHNPRTLVEKVGFVTGTRWKVGDRARQEAGLQPGPIIVVTNLAVLIKDEDDRPFRVESLHPGVDVATVVANTGFELDVPEHLPATAEPTAEQLELLRTKIDPFGTVKFDFVSGKDRLSYLRDVLDAEWNRATAS
ncbi:CoA-transferase subunit beta [Acrocarpospora macrocephala]|uniref:3-oxoadipate--succinyl-CoA transferase subunit B n=1 Tax=Acrocarpospora macrocephala TaxID=150177 RepID=A0A5M3WQF5_9ACTN|nr:CoA-transferase [Acrocarpospora macrocephala]GES11525.1 3-oxoadipate--succinyl-CoA transferase subunit B [Acrocarpospora macrocephala]